MGHLRAGHFHLRQIVGPFHHHRNRHRSAWQRYFRILFPTLRKNIDKMLDKITVLREVLFFGKDKVPSSSALLQTWIFW